MNIFFLSNDPVEAAQNHNDKHVIKMILESAQLLCGAHIILDGENESLYRLTHKNHPCSVWCRESLDNYIWLYRLFVSLCDEYTHRYGKVHLTDKKLRQILSLPPKNINSIGFTRIAQAMPEQYRHIDPIIAYRQYYVSEKAKFSKWTNRTIPIWFNV